MKYLVTGGAGFIGSNLVAELLKLGHAVSVIDDLSTGNYRNIKEFEGKIEFIKGSILDQDLLRKAMGGCDIVFHQAAIPSVGRSLINPKATSEANIEGTLNVLLVARDLRIKKVIIASSSSVYGDTKVLPKQEEMISNPKSPYALTKFVAEQYCKMFSKYYGLSTVCLRYFNVFGPRQDPNSDYAAVIPRFIRAVLDNVSPTIYGDGKQTRDFTYVADVVNANILASKSKVSDGTHINIACNKNISINGLLDTINVILKKNVKPTYKEARQGDVRDSLADISIAKTLLGYNCSFDLKKGLEKTIEWMRRSK